MTSKATADRSPLRGPPLRVVVLGAGGHARVAVATLQAAGHAVVALFDDTFEQDADVEGVPVRGPIADLALYESDGGLCAIGDNRSRRRIVRSHDLTWIAVAHPEAVVHRGVSVAPGTVVFAGAVVQPGARLGEHVILNTAASVDHDCSIHDFAHIGPGAHLCGAVVVGEGALLGVGCSVVPGITIGAWAVVGAGAAVVDDVPAGAIVVGVPARPVG